MAEIEPHTAGPLIEFPCDFPVKVMGETQKKFPKTIITLIQTILPAFTEAQIESRISSSGKYTSLTCNVHVSSQDQLDEIYRLLSSHPLVKFAL
jgi:putative lipoic acid-binding regulatory protein